MAEPATATFLRLQLETCKRHELARAWADDFISPGRVVQKGPTFVMALPSPQLPEDEGPQAWSFMSAAPNASLTSNALIASHVGEVPRFWQGADTVQQQTPWTGKAAGACRGVAGGCDAVFASHCTPWPYALHSPFAGRGDQTLLDYQVGGLEVGHGISVGYSGWGEDGRRAWLRRGAAGAAGHHLWSPTLADMLRLLPASCDL